MIGPEAYASAQDVPSSCSPGLSPRQGSWGLYFSGSCGDSGRRIASCTASQWPEIPERASRDQRSLLEPRVDLLDVGHTAQDFGRSVVQAADLLAEVTQ